MKRKYILQHIAALLLTFLAFAFIEAKINPFEWKEDTRALMLVANSIIQWAVWVLRNNP